MENKILIKTICKIVNKLTIHQVAEDETLLKDIKNWVAGVTDEVYHKAISICKENGIITGTINGTHYQTNSVLKKQKTGDEMFVIIRQLQHEK